MNRIRKGIVSMKNEKKVLFFVEAMGGGVFTYITNLANALSNRFDIYVAYGIRPQTPANYMKFFNNNVHLIEVKHFRRDISLEDLNAFYEMKRIAKKVNPDIIHLHSSKAGLLGRWAFNGRKVPIFYTPHGYSFLMSGIGKKKQLFFKLIEKFSALRNSTTISCSYGERLETNNLTKRSLYVDNGINIQYINSVIKTVSKRKKDKFTIYTLGRISKQKDPYTFNKIASMFPQVKFVWIGDGELRDVLVAPNITITGWMSTKEALKLAINYDAFILTSLWEGLPMALLESMYIEKPCIVSNVIGNNNVIVPNKNGFLCSNIDDYRYAITTLLTKGSPASIVKNAKKSIVEHYNSQVMADKYAEIYADALYKK